MDLIFEKNKFIFVAALILIALLSVNNQALALTEKNPISY